MKTIKQLIVIGFFGALIAIGVSVAGLYNSAQKKLIGKWDVSFEMTQTDLRQMGVTNNPLVAATAQTFVAAMQANMQVEFRKDKTASLGVTTLGFRTGESGTWSVAASKGEEVTVAIQFEGDESAKEWTLRFLDDNTFQMAPPKDSRFPINQIVVFKRVVENAS